MNNKTKMKKKKKDLHGRGGWVAGAIGCREGPSDCPSPKFPSCHLHFLGNRKCPETNISKAALR
jgi:hypothetical protein